MAIAGLRCAAVLSGVAVLVLTGCSRLTPGTPDATPGRPDTRPRFAGIVDDLTARAGERVHITLPPATGGSGSLRYALSPAVPGLDFAAETRTLAGTAEISGEYEMTYRVEDSDDNSDPSDGDVRMFLITVNMAPGSGGDPPDEPDGVRAPVNLTVVSADGSVTLSWDAPMASAGIMRHEYRFRTDQDYPNTWTAIPDSGRGGPNHAGFEVPGLMNGTTYTFQVRAVGAGGASSPSDEVTATPAPGICHRTLQIAAEIVDYIGRFGPQLGVSRVSECGEVTAAHLAVVLALDLTHGQITALKRGDFAGLTAIEGLYLHSNALTVLPDGVFAGLSSLENLALYNNDLQSVTAAAFVGLPPLDSLLMQGNALNYLADGTFAGLPSLTSLHLGGNGLTEFRRGIISDLSSLEELYLWENEIAELAADTLGGLTALTRLELQYNRLQQLPAGLFAGLSSLEHLYLEHNGLTDVRAGLFAGLSSLIELRLFLNELEDLPAGAFAGLTSLQRLYLSDNELTELPARAFAGLSSLASLDLSRNAVDPVPLTVTLHAAGTMQFKATVPSGAPFEIVLPVVVTNGSLSGGANTVTVPKGDLESRPHTVVRTPGTTGTVTVEIGDLPGLPSGHHAYALVEGEPLPLYRSLTETEYLLSEEANAHHLRDSLRAARSGGATPRALSDE